MAEELRSIEFDDLPPARASYRRGDRPGGERWPPGVDALVDSLQEQRKDLSRMRRGDQVVGVLVAGALLAFMFWTDGAGGLAGAIVVGGSLAAVYIPVRGGPIRRGLERIEEKLRIVDPRCSSCGYALRHLVRTRCPECGRRANLPSGDIIASVLRGDDVQIDWGNLVAELGWIVLALMIMLAVLVGRIAGMDWAFIVMPVPMMGFLIQQSGWRWRKARSVPTETICDSCGEGTPLAIPNCTSCGAEVLAAHVYVRPTTRQDWDPRLYCARSQLAGGLAVSAMLVLLGCFFASLADPYGRSGVAWLWIEPVLLVIAFAFLLHDNRKRSKRRLTDWSLRTGPRCTGCQGSLADQPADGECPHCKRHYTAAELAGRPKW